MSTAQKTQQTKKKGGLRRSKHGDLIFYIVMLAFPVAQFAVFYIGVNAESFLLAFQKIDIDNNATTWTFQNIIDAFKLMTTNTEILTMAGMSLYSYALILFIGTPLGLLFSYYIHKRLPGNGAFRLILFLPSIISAIVMVTIYQFFVERAVPAYVNAIFGSKIEGLLENQDARFATIMFYNIWVGFGTSVLMYANGMDGISPEISEAAHLDGATGIREFIHVTLPGIFPTLSTFIIAGVATIFTNQLNLYSFYGDAAPGDIQTFGYYLYNKTQAATSRAEYPALSAMGLILTAIAVPLTLLVKWLLEKFGPQSD